MRKTIISGGENIKGAAGVTISKDTVILIKICNMEKKIKYFIMESKTFENLLIRLHLIKEFKLCQEENLNITQM